MAREFLEETGALVAEHEWTSFGKMTGDGYKVQLFFAFADREVSTQTEGLVRWYDLKEVFNGYPLMENLSWLIPLALDKNVAMATIINF